MIFIDTGFFLALFSQRDTHHERVRATFERYIDRNLPQTFVTTDVVILEAITAARARVSHELAVFVGERLYSEKIARIYVTSLEEHRAAFEYLRRYNDKTYSAVDCLSFVVMEKLGIRDAFAVDDDFTHRFVAIPGPLTRRR